MNTVPSWALGLCCAAIACTLLRLLVPERGIGKLFAVLSALCFLCCFVSPLLTLSGQLTLPAEHFPREVQDGLLLERMNRQTRQAAETAVASAVRSVLDAYGYTTEKVEIQTDTSEEGYIYMVGVTVWTDGKSALHSSAIAALLRQRLGVAVTVRVAE